MGLNSLLAMMLDQLIRKEQPRKEIVLDLMRTLRETTNLVQDRLKLGTTI